MRPSFFSPNRNSPRKLDSRKNENTPSIAGSQRFGLQVDEQQRQPHRQLRKNIVKRNREREVQPVYVHCLSHRVTSWRFFAMFSVAADVSPQHASNADGPPAFS